MRTKKPKWTCGRNTQVAKRKQERFARAIAAAVCAALVPGKTAYFDDYLTRDQLRILTAEADAQGMPPGDWVNALIRKGIETSKAEAA